MTADEIITLEVASWPGVTAGAGSRGEFSFKVGRREIGHLHGDWVAHFGFPKDVWQELYDAGRIDYHSVFPGKKGWARAADRDRGGRRSDVIALLRLNYDRASPRTGARLVRAVWLREFGPPSVLVAGEAPEPAGEVVIEVALREHHVRRDAGAGGARAVPGAAADDPGQRGRRDGATGGA